MYVARRPDLGHVAIPDQQAILAAASAVGDDHYGVDLERRINDVLVHYVEHGSGVLLVALRGAGVDHREIDAAIEAITPSAGYQRIYPDLPGMGRSTTHGLTCNDDVTLLGDVVEPLGVGPMLLLGHSYGAYLARGVAAQRPDIVLGLTLLCPVAERSGNLSDPDVVRQDADTYDELEPAQRASSTSTSSCAPRPPPAATATTSCRARRSSTRPRWAASSPYVRSTSDPARSRRRP